MHRAALVLSGELIKLASMQTTSEHCLLTATKLMPLSLILGCPCLVVGKSMDPGVPCLGRSGRNSRYIVKVFTTGSPSQDEFKTINMIKELQ